MKTLSSIFVAGVSAVAMLAAAPVSAQDNPPVAGEKRMLPDNPMNTEPLNPPGPAGSRDAQSDGSAPDGAVPVAGEKRMQPDNVMNTEPLNSPGPAGDPNASTAGSEAVGAIGSDWLPTENIPAAQLVGADVVTAQNQPIGEVESTMVVDGKTAYLVSVGEHLGMGSRLISIHENHTSVFRSRGDTTAFRIAVDVTEEQIRRQPAYMRDGSPKGSMHDGSTKGSTKKLQ